MEIKTVALIGAGAVGCYFVSGLKEKSGENLWVIAEGERKERLEREGLWINGQQFFPCVKAPEEAVGADLILVSVKYGGLEKILPWIETMTDSHTVVMSLLNGVDSEEIIGKRIGMEHMVYSLMKIASQRTGNQIRYDPEKTAGVFFGEKDCCVSERVKALCRLLDGSGVHYRVCQNVMQDLWYKFSLNISKNLPQAILNCGQGAYTDSEHVAYISERMRLEVVAVAEAKGIDIHDADAPAARNSGVLPDARYSTLQDLDAHRPTEIDMFSGALIRMGKELGIEVPFSEFVFHAIKALEEKNCGKIR